MHGWCGGGRPAAAATATPQHCAAGPLGRWALRVAVMACRTRLRVAVVGAGGVGGWVGAKLLRHGAVEVIFVLRRTSSQLSAMRERGLSYRAVEEGDEFELAAADVPCYADDELEALAPVDVLLLCMKTFQVASALPRLNPLVGKQTMIVPTQNGVEAPDTISAVYGEGRTVGGVARVLSYIDQPGVIRKHVPGSIEVGEYYSAHQRQQQQQPSARVVRFTDALTAAGVQSIASADIRTSMWNKFTAMACNGPIGAVTRAPLDVIYAEPETRALLSSAVDEVVAVGAAHGVRIEPSVVGAIHRRQPAPNSTFSTTRDVVSGRPSELHELSGAVVRLGRSATPPVPTPTHSFVLAALVPQELLARGQRSFTLDGVPPECQNAASPRL